MPKVTTGLKCPTCGAITRVITHRARQEGVIVRHRVCPGCGYTGESIEEWDRTIKEGSKADKA